MKILDIAFKDLKRTFQNVFSLVMMFGAPLMITGLLYFAFGGITSGQSNFALPQTKVALANLDAAGTGSGGFDAGQMLIQFLQDPSLADVLAVDLVADEAQARAAVDGQKAGIAVIIPQGFAAAATTPGRSAAVNIYQDPTLTIGPGIVKDLISHFMDGFSGSKIAGEVVLASLNAHGVQADPALVEQTAQQYAAWMQTSGHDENSAVPHLVVVSPTGEAASQQQAVPIGLIMAGMLIFFVFFIGANGAESIILEDEEGTLARMFTTPTSKAAILGGKLLSVVVSLCIQVAILLLASSLLFGIQWGRTATIVLISLALIVAAAGFGVMLMSFLKNSRQTGPVLGGVMTLTGLLGGLFTVAIPNVPASFSTVTLFTPHGWALQAWKQALAGAGVGQVIVPLLVLLGMGILFFAAGVALLRRRFA